MPAEPVLHPLLRRRGGGPGGLMLGFLLARAGVDVVVLEKHADFLRDFRGDTIHPSTLELMAELGLLEEFLRLPHQEAARSARIRHAIVLADFRHLPTRCKFIAIDAAVGLPRFPRRSRPGYPAFRFADACGGRRLSRRAAASPACARIRPTARSRCAPLLSSAATAGIRPCARAPASPVEDLGAPMDVLWFRLPATPDDPDETVGRFDAGRIFVLLDRGDYWQCAFVIPKGAFEEMRRAGLPAFREDVARRDAGHRATGWGSSTTGTRSSC